MDPESDLDPESDPDNRDLSCLHCGRPTQHLDVSKLQWPELHLDAPKQPEPVLVLDVSTPQGPKLHLDLSGQQDPLLLLDVSTLQGRAAPGSYL
jgi:hypothetical protein